MRDVEKRGMKLLAATRIRRRKGSHTRDPRVKLVHELLRLRLGGGDKLARQRQGGPKG
jgi:hypothetical protein